MLTTNWTDRQPGNGARLRFQFAELVRHANQIGDFRPMPLLLALALIIGFVMGAVGVGGILLLFPVTVLGGLEVHEASATLLLTFLFTGLYGAWLFHRRGNIDWPLCVPVCLGAFVFSFIGAVAN